MYCDLPILQRCCFCLPLRRGVLVIAYVKILFGVFMIGLYSYSINMGTGSELLFNGMTVSLPAEICLFLYCVECIFSALLAYGTHKKIHLLLKICFYYSVSTILLALLMQIIEVSVISHIYFVIEIVLFFLTELCMQVYALMLLWSLLKKWELDEPHVYDNQLHQIINGQAKPDTNQVYNSSTEPVDV